MVQFHLMLEVFMNVGVQLQLTLMVGMEISWESWLTSPPLTNPTRRRALTVGREEEGKNTRSTVDRDDEHVKSRQTKSQEFFSTKF